MDLQRNKINLVHYEPDYITEFQKKLGQRRWIKPDTVYFSKSHTILIIENCYRTLPLLRMYFKSLTPTLKIYPQVPGKETASLADHNCGILKVRF